jgi:uncharacterized protein with von Willebrand factor type A (vWA) domain
MSPIGARLAALFGHAGQKIATQAIKLRRSVIRHDSIDQLEFDNYVDDSPRFKRLAIDEAPQIDPSIPEPTPLDITTATPEEFKEYQQEMKTYKDAVDNAPPYKAWGDLTRDVFYSYHSHDQPDLAPDPIDPGVELHKRILPKLFSADEHAESRNVTRDDATMSALATMAAVGKLKETIGDELAEQAAESQKFEEERQKAQEALGELQGSREEAQALHEQGKPIPQRLLDQIKQQVKEKQKAQEGAAEIAAAPTPMSSAAVEAITAAASAGQEAAKAAAGIPSFGQGLGAGEPQYQSPEQALSIAEQWANNPNLRKMAELFGRIDRDMRFQRSKRVVGGQEEIVDVKFGDDLNRIVSSEWALFADDDMEDDFLARFTSGELLTYSTVGEEHAGRGPIVFVADSSGSMTGESNIWTRAVAMSLLHMARTEKRDFAFVEFSTQSRHWLFRAKSMLDPEQVVDMCSHFYGGGTLPILGVQEAAKVMTDAPEFRRADVVMVGDGRAGYGPEDERLRVQLTEMGVKFYGIGIGGTHAYLEKYCEHVVPISDFDLSDPSKATAELAVHIT